MHQKIQKNIAFELSSDDSLHNNIKKNNGFELSSDDYLYHYVYGIVCYLNIGQSWFEAQQVQKALAYCYVHQNGYGQLWNE